MTEGHDYDRDLDRFWDAIARRDESEDHGPWATPDPADRAVVRRLHAAGSVSPPEHVRTRVRRTVLADAGAPPAADGNGQWPTAAVADRASRPLTRVAPTRSVSPRSWPRLRTHLSTAALLLLTLGSVALAFSGGSLPRFLRAPRAASMPMAGGNPAHTGVQPGPGPGSAPTPLWSVRTDGDVPATIAVVDGIAYVAHERGQLLALDAATGAERWHHDVAGGVGTSSPSVADGVVYLGGGGPYVRAFDAATGRERWTFTTTSDVESAPVVVDGVLYVGSGVYTTPGIVYALDAATGAERWHHEVDGTVYADVAVANGAVYAATGTGSWGRGRALYALDAATGEERWQFNTAGGVFGAPAVADGRVYVGSTHAFWALDAATGTVRWRFTAPDFRGTLAAPAVADGVVYVVGSFRFLYAIDTVTGAERWRFDISTGGDGFSSPAVAGGVVYVGSTDHNVYAVDALTGEERWRVATELGVEGSPTVLDGVLYVGTGAPFTSGAVYALASGVPPMRVLERQDASGSRSVAAPQRGPVDLRSVSTGWHRDRVWAVNP